MAGLIGALMPAILGRSVTGDDIVGIAPQELGPVDFLSGVDPDADLRVDRRIRW